MKKQGYDYELVLNNVTMNTFHAFLPAYNAMRENAGSLLFKMMGGNKVLCASCPPRRYPAGEWKCSTPIGGRA